MQNKRPFDRTAALRCNNRRGMAPLELALALPILVALLSIIFGICSISQTRMIVTVEARNQAFAKRHEPWKHQAESLNLTNVDKVNTILGPNPEKMQADAGLVSGESAASPQGLFGPIKSLSLSTNCQRFVFAGRWDHKEIDFKKHAALTLTDKAEYFGLSSSNLQSFKRIASFGGGFSGGSFGSLQSGVQASVGQSLATIRQRIQKIEAELRTLNSRLKEQERKLASLERAVPRDAGAIDKANKEVRNIRAQIKELKHEQALQQYAMNSMNTNLTIPNDDVSGLIDSDGQIVAKDQSWLNDQAVSAHKGGQKSTEGHVDGSRQAQKFLKEQASKAGKR